MAEKIHTHPSPAGPPELDPQCWLDEHGDALYRYALARLRDPDRAEDLVQETLLAALRGRENFGGRASVRTWLIGILKRKVVDEYRQRWREQPATELAADDEGDRRVESLFDQRGHWQRDLPAWSDPRAALEQKEFWQTFQHCLSLLPGRLADAFVLREVEQMSGEEVRQVLGITPTNLWAMLHRARMRLRECIAANWFNKPREETTP